ncbi:MAG: type IV toxin-antitoxin system AbiEi family antitoxin domain-containing protein, partial [Nocardiopsaceae bacterium]|nr:type IV toxin-antitoxin system AbiEi family antitoxin domain-containing protein [Nocardiopsaceae bacterium]
MSESFREQQRDLLWLQRGVLTRQQALAAGLTSKTIESRLSGGRWQRLHRGVYATFSGEVPRPAQLWAAVLKAGPAAALSHQTAAELHGLLDVPAPLIHVTLPIGSTISRPSRVVVHYSGRLAQARHPALAPPRTRVADTVLDLAGSAATLDDAVGLVLRAVGRRRITADQMAAAIHTRSRVRWRADLLRAVGAAGEGAHSLLEYRYATRVEAAHGLPRGNRQ